MYDNESMHNLSNKEMKSYVTTMINSTCRHVFESTSSSQVQSFLSIELHICKYHCNNAYDKYDKF